MTENLEIDQPGILVGFRFPSSNNRITYIKALQEEYQEQQFVHVEVWRVMTWLLGPVLHWSLPIAQGPIGRVSNESSIIWFNPVLS